MLYFMRGFAFVLVFAYLCVLSFTGGIDCIKNLGKGYRKRQGTGLFFVFSKNENLSVYLSVCFLLFPFIWCVCVCVCVRVFACVYQRTNGRMPVKIFQNLVEKFFKPVSAGGSGYCKEKLHLGVLSMLGHYLILSGWWVSRAHVCVSVAVAVVVAVAVAVAVFALFKE